MKYVCELCGFIYDEDIGDPKKGIAPGTPFCLLPEDYECARCGYKKEAFNPVRCESKSRAVRLQSTGRTGIRR